MIEIGLPERCCLDYECLYLIALSRRFPGRLSVRTSRVVSSPEIRLDGTRISRVELNSALALREVSVSDAAIDAMTTEKLMPSIYFLLFKDETIYSNFTCEVEPSFISRFSLKRKFPLVMRTRGRCLEAISKTLEYLKNKFVFEDFQESHPHVYAQVSACLLLLFSIPGDQKLCDIFKQYEHSLGRLLDVSIWQAACGDSPLQGFNKTFQRPASFWDKLFPKEKRKSPDWQRKLFVFGATLSFVGFIMSGMSVLGSGGEAPDDYDAIEADQ